MGVEPAAPPLKWAWFRLIFALLAHGRLAMSFEESLECNVGSLTEEVLQKLLEIDEWYFSDSDSEESEATEESEAEEEAKSPKPQVF